MGSLSGESTIDNVDEREVPDEFEISELVPIEDVTENLRGFFRAFDKYDGTYIVGEVSDPSGGDGNLYFSITSHDGTAKLNCVCWESNRDSIDVDLQEDMLVAVSGEMIFFEKGGHPSLEVTDIQLVGESAYWQRRAELERQLESEGLFSDRRKDTIPVLPESVGVVTASGSDAEQDLVESIHEHHPGVDIEIYGATVQGSNAPAELSERIRQADDAEIDVLVVSRGGGSNIALRTFSEEPVVRVVAEADTPTVSAIGHDADEPLVDEVADLRVKTPTAVGSAVVLDYQTYQEEVEQAIEQVDTAFSSQVSRWVTDAQAEVERATQQQQSEWIETHRDDIEVEGFALMEDWLVSAHHDIEAETEQFTDEWFSSSEVAVHQAATQHISNWFRQRQQDIEGGAADVTDKWLRVQRRAIKSESRRLTHDWMDSTRGEIRTEYNRIDREHDIQTEKQGLKRRNKALLALVVTLCLIICVLAGITLGLI
jgi:exodeoxyribonuclease VII large subunit